MWTKLFIVSTCLYVVKASVVPCISDGEDVSKLEATQKACCGCNDYDCNNNCQQRGYPWGQCVSNDCQCRYGQPTSTDLKGDNSDVSEIQMGDCNWARCQQDCQRMGFWYGMCINRQCQCDGHHSAIPAVSEPLTKLENTLKDNLITSDLLSDNEVNAEVSEAKLENCDWRYCDHHCQQIGYPDGRCVNGRCQCYRNKVNSTESEAELVDCNWRYCDQHCQQIGYPDGRCVNGRCQCYGNKVNPKETEAMLVDCNWRYCDQHCQDMGYQDGRCVRGRCQCYDNKVNSKGSEAKLEDCNWRDCDEYCQQMGYQDGRCQNGRCQCYGNKISEDKVEDCNWNWCEQHCRNMGFPYANCVNGRCECNKYRSDKASVFALLTKTEKDNPDALEAKLEDCNWSYCDQRCRQMGYSDGRCVNGRCQCYGNKVNAEESVTKLEECNWGWCRQHCRQMGYRYGRCVNGRCQCNGNKINAEESETKLEECNWNWCRQHCRQMGYPYGRCVNGRCQCNSNKNSLDVSEAKLEDCNWNRCDQHCRQMGYPDGQCINGRCQCYQRESAKPTVDVPLAKLDSLLNSEVLEVKIEDCNWRWCDQHCHQMGYPDGTCVNGRCQCNNHRSVMPKVDAPVTKTENTLKESPITPTNDLASDKVKPEVSEAKLEDCSWSRCAEYCRNMGYPYGRCINGRCQCNRPRSAMPTVPVSLTKIGNILEKDFLNPTNDLLTAKGGNPEVSQDCTWRWCEQQCQQMGYPDGRCVNGRCRCDRRRSAMVAVPALFMKLGDQEEIESKTVKSCSSNSCVQFCLRLGFRFSKCYNGRCNCFR